MGRSGGVDDRREGLAKKAQDVRRRRIAAIGAGAPVILGLRSRHTRDYRVPFCRGRASDASTDCWNSGMV